MDEWMDEWMDGRNKCCTSIRWWQFWMQCMESLFIPSQDWDCISLGSVAFVLTLHFCITLYVLPPPLHTRTCSQTTLSAEVTFQWLKVAYKYPIILTPFFNILFISRQTFIFEWYVNSLDSAKLVFLCRFQILLLLTQMSQLVSFLFFWISTFQESCPFHDYTAHQRTWENQRKIWTSKQHQLEDNQGPQGQKGEDKKNEKQFSFYSHLRRWLRCAV